MISVSVNKLDEFAQYFWQQVKNEKLFLFYGEMGAGKTTIIEALCAAKGVKDRMSSPTFSIINEYNYVENERVQTIYHIDLYRLKDEEEIIQAGVEDVIGTNAIIMIEWPQKAPDLLGENTAVKIYIKAVTETLRSINIVLPQASITEQL